MISVEEALRLVQQHAEPLSPQKVNLSEAAGLALADDAASDVNSPPHDKALMDGYAVSSRDSQPERRVIGQVAAGEVPHHAVTPGTAVRIMTGAPVPEGADAVVPLEQIDEIVEAPQPRSIRLRNGVPKPGANILPLGASARAGQTVVRRNAILRPIEIAILAEAGSRLVNVVPRPTVAVLPTGSELVDVGKRLEPGQIRNSNGPLLLAAARDAGGTAVNLGIGRDDPDELGRRIVEGLKSHVLLVSGGVSAGDFDFVPRALAELGVRQVFHKVALRPGKPLWFGVHSGGKHQTLVFGLPGNPVSSLVCFELFVRPTIAALAGRGFCGPPMQQAILANGYEHAGGRAAYLPAKLTAGDIGTLNSRRTGGDNNQNCPLVNLVPWHGSADVAALAHANGLLALPPVRISLKAGDVVQVLLI